MENERSESERDDVSILDSSNNIIDGIHIMDVSVSPNARAIMHPVESGAKTVDNKVLDPIKLTIKAYITYEDKEVINTLYKMWRNRKYEFYTVTTREGQYKRLMVISIPHRETPRMFKVFDFTITFQELLIASYSNTKPSDGTNSDSVRSGRIGGALGY